jgi:hypothetical protein
VESENTYKEVAKVKTNSKMDKKNLAVSATAAPIGAEQQSVPTFVRNISVGKKESKTIRDDGTVSSSVVYSIESSRRNCDYEKIEFSREELKEVRQLIDNVLKEQKGGEA